MRELNNGDQDLEKVLFEEISRKVDKKAGKIIFKEESNIIADPVFKLMDYSENSKNYNIKSIRITDQKGKTDSLTSKEWFSSPKQIKASSVKDFKSSQIEIQWEANLEIHSIKGEQVKNQFGTEEKLISKEEREKIDSLFNFEYKHATGVTTIENNVAQTKLCELKPGFFDKAGVFETTNA